MGFYTSCYAPPLEGVADNTRRKKSRVCMNFSDRRGAGNEGNLQQVHSTQLPARLSPPY